MEGIVKGLIYPLIFFTAILSQLKIPCLEADRKEAKQQYQDNLTAYTKDRLGRPLEKLHVSYIQGM